MEGGGLDPRNLVLQEHRFQLLEYAIPAQALLSSSQKIRGQYLGNEESYQRWCQIERHFDAVSNFRKSFKKV